ncbi:outer membrane protein [Flammeovirga kamogawensis]|uniref:Outer membrane protein beta-barrel domain-containing protein n=1 Tax=Flammeovirga kamogawensis TaxID=373891 RepID=A0ABX8H057_9BACT|nr:outer membrane beta-barrel protein [Flammeovirga kamogawensis]MBB6459497.1 opacity protein-like surface antigen [Flammeovirga kamogawensis]QWG09049.1 hypothetical protein KM029_08920 [Flammeovirga kamogawensis]TRX67337.1 hypothetical protein EO216_03960 [Flammeovirga kamogawensis]
MKNLILSIFFLFSFSLISNAQVRFGLGGGLSSGTGDLSEYSDVGFNIYAEIGAGITDHSEVTILGQIDLMASGNDALAEAWLLMPVMLQYRYYILTGTLKPYAGVGLGGVRVYNSTVINSVSSDPLVDEWNFGYKIAAGLKFAILNLQFSYIGAGQVGFEQLGIPKSDKSMGSFDISLGLLF